MTFVMHSRRSLLYNKGEPWVKKEDEHFDVTMGAYDGAEVCELVGIYFQYLLSKSYDKNDYDTITITIRMIHLHQTEEPAIAQRT